MSGAGSTDLEQTLIGDSPEIRKLRSLVARVARLDLPVMIEGPTGSGKELVAQALHAMSGRSGRLVAFNVCAFAESMFEDALFGHTRGSFTGAMSTSPGLLLEADRGTAFFDEIGSLPMARQASLLRAIETRSFRPIGAAADKRSDFRLVSASNVSLATLIGAGQFREDLAYRLCGVVIRVGALQDRRADIEKLIDHFLTEHRQAGGFEVSMSRPARNVLGAFHWPGNVRQLKQVVRCAAALAQDQVIGEEEVRQTLQACSPRELSRIGPRVDAEDEADTLRQVLERHGWDTSSAAEELGIARQTIYKRLRRLGVSIPAKYGSRTERVNEPSLAIPTAPANLAILR